MGADIVIRNACMYFQVILEKLQICIVNGALIHNYGPKIFKFHKCRGKISFFKISNSTCVQQDFYVNNKQVQKVVGHLLNNNTIMWFTYFSKSCYFQCDV